MECNPKGAEERVSGRSKERSDAAGKSRGSGGAAACAEAGRPDAAEGFTARTRAPQARLAAARAASVGSGPKGRREYEPHVVPTGV